ncbi:MAG: hypothetical protein O2816_07920 [Planctomycetota bacterium]|nr:hypothetical protein [Planctomycetota bacterium]
MSQPPKFKRRKKLIKPRLQLKLTLTFVGLSALSLLLQLVLFQAALSNAALDLPNDSELLMSNTNDVVLRVVAISFGVFLPLTFMVGILSTFRIAGPVYRFEQFLEAVRRGERPRDFRLRKGDELTGLAQLINDATQPLRTEEKADEPGAGDQDLDAAPSLTRESDVEAPEREQA